MAFIQVIFNLQDLLHLNGSLIFLKKICILCKSYD